VQFRDGERQMAAVIDEWGVFEGIATVEDVVEAVVGDLRDGFDAEGPDDSIRRRDDGGYDADGSAALSTLNGTLGTSFAADGFETVGGLVLSRLDRAPEVGDSVRADGFAFEVRRVDGARVSAVRIGRADGEGERESGADSTPDGSET
jgi:CBS domain containing-hemolysin-like protein